MNYLQDNCIFYYFLLLYYEIYFQIIRECFVVLGAIKKEHSLMLNKVRYISIYFICNRFDLPNCIQYINVFYTSSEMNVIIRTHD